MGELALVPLALGAESEEGDADALGAQKEALGYLERAYEERDMFLPWILLLPRPAAPEEAQATYDAFHAEPRVRAIMRKMGLVR